MSLIANRGEGAKGLADSELLQKQKSLQIQNLTLRNTDTMMI